MDTRHEDDFLTRKAEIEDILKKIELQYFSKQRGFLRDFGLTIFPFFTFFDSLLERIELDFRLDFNQTFLLKKFIYHPQAKVMESVVASVYISIKEQWEGVQRDAAERFVERYAALLTECNLLFHRLPSSAGAHYEQLMMNLQSAVALFFTIKEQNWQDGALHSMGIVLGQRASEAIPSQEQLMQALQKLKGRHFLHQLDDCLQEQRMQFHEELHRIFFELYVSVYNEMERDWQQFRQQVMALFL